MAKIDDDALNELASLAKSRVPIDAGLLLNGTAGKSNRGRLEFPVSAVRSTQRGQSEDYAHFVEFGYHAGGRSFSQRGRGRRRLRGPSVGVSGRIEAIAGRSPDIPAERFFYGSAFDALEAIAKGFADELPPETQQRAWLSRRRLRYLRLCPCPRRLAARFMVAPAGHAGDRFDVARGPPQQRLRIATQPQVMVTNVGDIYFLSSEIC